MAASKKWKYTVRVQHDGRPIGTWLEMHGYAPKAALYVLPMQYLTLNMALDRADYHCLRYMEQCVCMHLELWCLTSILAAS